MARHLTRGILVVADQHPSSAGIISAATTYAYRQIAVAERGNDVAGFTEVVDPGRRGLSLDRVFRIAAEERIPWVGVRRDRDSPVRLIGEALTATGRRATKAVPGFALVLYPAQHRPVERILAVVDRTDSPASGLLVMIAVGAAAASGAALDVLVIDEPGGHPEHVQQATDMLSVRRDEDLYALALQRAEEEGLRPDWILAADADKQALVLRTIRDGGYDLLIDDLGAIKLGGRVGRGRRIARALADGGPGGIARAVLESTDLPMVLVIDAVRLGAVPPSVVRGGAGAMLAFGLLSSMAPAASASQRTEFAASVSVAADAYGEALDEAAGMAAPQDVAQAEATARQAEQSAREAYGRQGEAGAGDAEDAQDTTEVAHRL